MIRKKYAYLIIAHDNFNVLGYLIKALDDPRNDIYLHLDKKSKNVPEFHTKYANLNILSERLDVRWGDVSQIECEYLLFDAVWNSGTIYQRYNLISGTHYPLKSQDDMDVFFAKVGDEQLLSFLYTNDYEIHFKLGYYHFFLDNFQSGSRWKRTVCQKLWQICLKVQKKLNFKRPLLNISIKANNWVSITHDALIYIMSQKKYILQRFKRTFCGDEYFIPFLLQNSLEFRIKNEPLLVYNDFQEGSNPVFLDDSIIESLEESDYLFARKIDNETIRKIKEL